MSRIALVTDADSINNDFDMPLLIDALKLINVKTDVVQWDDKNIDWSIYTLVVIRSPWSYLNQHDDFIKWCEYVDNETTLLNPLRVIKWGLNKRYLIDLKNKGIGIVTTSLILSNVSDVKNCVNKFIEENNLKDDIVIKPSVGAYSRGVRKFSVKDINDIVLYIKELHSCGNDVLLQPYLTSINSNGETDLVFFEGKYSHSIRKSALLQPDGSICEPLQEYRQTREASIAEWKVAQSALKAVTELFSLEESLLYARIDLVLNDSGLPVVLEMEICEPSLNLPFAEGSALRFAEAIRRRLFFKEYIEKRA
ncbi:hypothetical protein KX75_20080 [Salmonella enterica subsp. enterica]|nr:hypothetical protein [Salmonella enterica subsp. enterica serovar Mikawasima]EDN7229174.1 hypothetical protein [Salmonella enterica subsp. enterica serovar Mikawasima]